LQQACHPSKGSMCKLMAGAGEHSARSTPSGFSEKAALQKGDLPTQRAR